ncbi:MKRN2 opposite strand protein isoform X2 [Aquila chrysaetos chrysaetos]|uniref:MKRN2 opposite strand protein isoform X2 n=1 Tax=Aquila chrysaetos chrysaetos TaxID=223781 RepID=UPI00117691AC|nr:MKRN2 opposite strand protein isoform X2 [Aquila chrysaetos chrysaetos]
MAEAAILRVRHCGAAIFCRRPPSRCPACGRPLRGAGLPAAPVRLPSPFRHGHRQPRAFLLRPAAGTFLGGYDGESDLHVGITSTHGVVYNYNEEGIHRAETGWEQCISIPLVQPDMFGLLQQWDKLLEEFSVGEAWLPHRLTALMGFLLRCYIQMTSLLSVIRSGKHSQAHFQLVHNIALDS